MSGTVGPDGTFARSPRCLVVFVPLVGVTSSRPSFQYWDYQYRSRPRNRTTFHRFYSRRPYTRCSSEVRRAAGRASRAGEGKKCASRKNPRTHSERICSLQMQDSAASEDERRWRTSERPERETKPRPKKKQVSVGSRRAHRVVSGAARRSLS